MPFSALVTSFILLLVKYNCTKSGWRPGQCICEKAKLCYTTLFACSMQYELWAEMGQKRCIIGC